MKPKFLLTTVTLNTLFMAGSIATASSISPAYNIFKLSQTIAKIVGFDGADPNLVKSAIDRALNAKEKAINLNTNLPHPDPQIAGGEQAVPLPIQKPTRTPIKKDIKNIDL
jgi:hypothetical protein